jgi:hypothetical protein
LEFDALATGAEQKTRREKNAPRGDSNKCAAGKALVRQLKQSDALIKIITLFGTESD